MGFRREFTAVEEKSACFEERGKLKMSLKSLTHGFFCPVSVSDMTGLFCFYLFIRP
jgi:hypothetical protein